MGKISDKKLKLINDQWMGKRKPVLFQDPFHDNHWFLRVGKAMVESTTREGCLKAAKEGESALLAEVLERDIKKYGGSPEDHQRLKKLKTTITNS